MTALADVAVIGGSGLYSLLEDAEEHRIDTPYGQPSDSITVADIGGRRVAFLPRHGRDHRSRRTASRTGPTSGHCARSGSGRSSAPCAVGGLQRDLGPGTFVLPDQLVDRTTGRVQTYYDTGAVHVSFADPYCPTGRSTVREIAGRTGIDLVDGGTMVVIEGPRFSTRAESRWYAELGGTVVNMTGHPEAVLARELALCYTAVALVTDLDAGVEGGHSVTQEEVFRVFGENTARLRTLLLDVAAALPEDADCSCHHALDGIDVPPPSTERSPGRATRGEPAAPAGPRLLAADVGDVGLQHQVGVALAVPVEVIQYGERTRQQGVGVLVDLLGGAGQAGHGRVEQVVLRDQAVDRAGQPGRFEHQPGVQPVVALGRRPVFGERLPQWVEKMPELTSPVLGHRADQART